MADLHFLEQDLSISGGFNRTVSHGVPQTAAKGSAATDPSMVKSAALPTAGGDDLDMTSRHGKVLFNETLTTTSTISSRSSETEGGGEAAADVFLAAHPHSDRSSDGCSVLSVVTPPRSGDVEAVVPALEGEADRSMITEREASGEESIASSSVSQWRDAVLALVGPLKSNTESDEEEEVTSMASPSPLSTEGDLSRLSSIISPPRLPASSSQAATVSTTSSQVRFQQAGEVPAEVSTKRTRTEAELLADEDEAACEAMYEHWYRMQDALETASTIYERNYRSTQKLDRLSVVHPTIARAERLIKRLRTKSSSQGSSPSSSSPQSSVVRSRSATSRPRLPAKTGIPPVRPASAARIVSPLKNKKQKTSTPTPSITIEVPVRARSLPAQGGRKTAAAADKVNQRTKSSANTSTAPRHAASARPPSRDAVRTLPSSTLTGTKVNDSQTSENTAMLTQAELASEAAMLDDMRRLHGLVAERDMIADRQPEPRRILGVLFTAHKGNPGLDRSMRKLDEVIRVQPKRENDQPFDAQAGLKASVANMERLRQIRPAGGVVADPMVVGLARSMKNLDNIVSRRPKRSSSEAVDYVRAGLQASADNLERLRQMRSSAGGV